MPATPYLPGCSIVLSPFIHVRKVDWLIYEKLKRLYRNRNMNSRVAFTDSGFILIYIKAKEKFNNKSRFVKKSVDTLRRYGRKTGERSFIYSLRSVWQMRK